MSEHSLAKKTFKGTVWTVVDILATKASNFIISIVLARLLTPDDYGLIGMLGVFIAISTVFIEAGFGNALIRKLDRSEKDLSMAFWFNIIVSIVAYCVLWIISPWVGTFFNEPILSDLLKVISINIFIQAFCIVPNAIIVAKFEIKKQAKANFAGNLISGIIAIALAYAGWGVWALAFQTLLASIIKMIYIWTLVRWIPKFQFSKESWRYLWSFGSKSIIIQLLGSFFNEIYNILIGKYFSKDSLGYYTRAAQFVRLFPDVISSSFLRVCIATFAELQNDKRKLLGVYRKYIHVVSMAVFPCMTLLFIIAKPLILFLLTPKWEPCVVLLQILCIGFAFSPFGGINLMLLQAINQIQYSMKLEFAKKSLFISMLLLTLPMGMVAMVVGSSAYNFIATVMNMSCSKRFIGYGYIAQIKDMFIYIICSCASGACSYLLTIKMSDGLECILVRTFVFAVVYLALSFLFRVRALEDLKQLKQSIK